MNDFKIFITVSAITAIQLLSCVSSKGWVLQSNNRTYVPVDICLFDRQSLVSYHYKCSSDELHFVAFTGTTCSESLLFDQSENLPHNCSVDTDYLQYTLWDLNLISENAECSDKLIYPRANSYAVITNKCVYEARYNLYKMDTCTDTIWTTFRYLDENCVFLRYANNVVEECKHNETFVEISTCTTKMNSIANQFGYIQLGKNEVLRPLNACITSSYTNSYLFLCRSNAVFMYQWPNSSCGSVITAVDIRQVFPLTFSCSSNTFDHATIHVYENNDNCASFDTQKNHTSFPLIVNQCLNFFDESNVMKSEIFYCDNASLWSTEYNLPDCDAANGKQLGSNYTELCSYNSTHRYFIECKITGLIVSSSTTTTTAYTTTTSTTYEPAPSTTTTTFTPAPTQRNKRFIYVTSDGEDNYECTLDGINCGTLKSASFAANWQFQYHNLTDVEIVIQGQNPIKINESLHRYAANGLSANPCLPHAANYIYTDYRSITYTFDTDYIHSMSDWYNSTLCENMDFGGDILYEHFFATQETTDELFTFTFNNLIIDHYSFEGKVNQPYYIATANTFICNNCIFRNITIHYNHHDRLYDERSNQLPTLIFSSNIHLSNCIINNITYIPSSVNNSLSVVDVHNYDHSFMIVDYPSSNSLSSHSFSLSINNTKITNINGLSSVVYIFAGSFTFNYHASIENVTFDNIYIMDAIIYNELDGNEAISSVLYITNTNFFNVHHGSIFYSTGGKLEIDIENIYITTAQTTSGYLATQQSIGRDDVDYYSLFVFDPQVSNIVSMNNIHLNYHYAHEMLTRCSPLYADSVWMVLFIWEMIAGYAAIDLDFYHFYYECLYPIQFIHNSAALTIDELHVSNDITDKIIDEFREYVKEEYDFYGALAGVDEGDDFYLEFSYELLEDDVDFGMIFNEQELSIESFYVYGYGVHETLLLNVDGDLTVNKMIAVPDTFCTTDELCEFDGDALHINYWIRFNGKDSICEESTLYVSNSYLFGAKYQAILSGSGYIYLHNITIQNSVTAIAAAHDVLHLELTSSKMMDIGTYYASSGKRLSAYRRIYTPFLLKPSQLIITDTVFSYVSPFQFDLFDATGYWGRLLLDSFDQKRDIILVNNSFEINDVNVLSRYPSNQSTSFLDDLSFEISLDEDNTTNVFSQPFFYNDAMLLIPNDANIQMINNKFTIYADNLYVDQSVLIENDLPFIASYKANDTNATRTSTVCMSGNEFTNFAIWLKNDNFNITSCVKADIIDYMHHSDCYSYGTFGSIYQSALNYNEGKANVFNIYANNINTIIRAEQDTFIALENNKINIYMNDTDSLNIMNGNYLLAATEIVYQNNETTNIFVNDKCDISCYSKTDEQFISVLHVICGRDMDNTSFASTTPIDMLYVAQNYSLLPRYIGIYPSNNNSEYVPGQRLKLDYFIYDINYNELHKKGVGIPIILTFVSTSTDEIVPNFQVIIQADGECAECNDGVVLSSLTLDKMGQNYSFNFLVDDNLLFADNILSVIVANCPIGYGATGTNLCDMCNRGYFNIFHAHDTCYYCNADTVDGISCPGSFHIMMDYNYWTSFYPLLFDNNTTEYITSYKCPPLYCCQIHKGCDFIDDAAYLCALNRDAEAPLCGQCVQGYSELFGSNNCDACDEIHWSRLLIPILYGLLWGLFILLKNTKSTKPKKHVFEPIRTLEDKHRCSSICNKCSLICNKCSCCKAKKVKDEVSGNIDKDRMTRDEYVETLLVMITKVILYYYQGISYILTTSGIRLALSGFVELSNMNIMMITSPGNNNGYCLLPNMNTIEKITIPLTTTFCILFVTVSLGLISKCSVNICCCLHKQIRFGRAMVSVMLICVGQILSVLFKLLACRDVGYVSVHYFFGAYECYSSIWQISFVCLLFVFVSFIALFVWIWCKKRKDANHNNPATSCYRKDLWFWECILLIRRTILALAFIVFDDAEIKMSIAIGLLLYLLIHTSYEPFKGKYENILETHLILATAICIFIDTTYSSQANSIFSNVAISFLIVLPLIWYLLFMFFHCKSLMITTTKADDDDEDNDDDEEEVQTNIEMTKRHGTHMETDGDSENETVALQELWQHTTTVKSDVDESSDSNQVNETVTLQQTTGDTRKLGRYVSMSL